MVGILILPTVTPAQDAIRLEGGISRTVAPPPKALSLLLEAQVKAANQRDIDELMATYSPDFKHQDGLDREQTQSALESLWSEYSDLSYSGNIISWKTQGDEVVALVDAQIIGRQDPKQGGFKVDTHIQFLNRYQVDPDDSEKLSLLSQEVVQETTRLSSGSNPPTVTVKLPERVKVGSTYSLEAIVQEPLRGDVLLGAVIAEPVDAILYQEPSSFPLEALQAGGIFRKADAPSEPGVEWVSVMLVNQGGVTLESRRVTITDKLILNLAPSKTTP